MEIIQDQKLNKNSFKETPNYYRLLFDNTAIGLALCKLTGELVDVNPAYARLLGRSVEETMKLSYWDITPIKYAEQEKAQLESLLKTGKYGPFEKEYLHKDKHLVPVRLSGQLVKLDQVDYIWSSVEDMTAKVQAENEERILKEQLVQAQKMEAVGQMTAGVAHNFNNVVTCISGFTDLMFEQLAKGRTEKLHEHLAKISASAEHAKGIVEQLMKFSRRNSGKKAEIDLNQLGVQVIEMLQGVTPSMVRLELVTSNKPEFVIADLNELKQVLINLCVNSREAIGESGVISVQVKGSAYEKEICQSCHHLFFGNYAEISVRDTGPGIAPQDLNKIFDPFFTTKGIGKGTGLGLSSVHRILHEHGGHILVDSEVEQGSNFRLLLPVGSQRGSSVVMNDFGLSANKDAPRILIVDDDLSQGRLIGESLAQKSFESELYDLPSSALEAFKRSPDLFDLVILDQTASSLSGIQLVSKIHQIRKDVPVIICTGNLDYDRTSILAMGFADLLRKPFFIDELTATCSKLLRAKGPQHTNV